MTMTTIETNSNNNIFAFKTPIFHIEDQNVDTNNIDASLPTLTCKVEISPGIYLYGAACDNHIWVSSKELHSYYLSWFTHNGQRKQRQIIEVDPFFTAEAIGQAYNQKIQKRVNDDSYNYGYNYSNWNRTKIIEDYDTYGDRYDYSTRKDIPGKPYNYLKVKLTFMGDSREYIFKFEQPEAGEVDIESHLALSHHIFDIQTDFFGLKSVYKWEIRNSRNYYPWHDAWNKLATCTFKQGVNPFLIRFFESFATNDSRGIKGIEKRKEVKPVLERLQREEPLLWAFYSFLKNGKTVKKMNNNRLLAAVLLDCGKNYKKLKSQLETVLRDTLGTEPKKADLYDSKRTMCMRFPTAQKTDAKARAKAEWHMREGLSAQAQGLGIHPRRHKNLMRAITKNQISLNLFHVTGDPLNLINAEFDLWERALRRKGWTDVIISICGAVTNKNRFEKHITPYLSFLFRIERYLKRHTGRNWTAFPKLVNSEAQLEMQERDENGTVKTRSALTPIADNEKNTITVPYTGLKMYGAQTTYCYSKHYFVFERDSIDQVSGSVIVNELEKKLNGRDDYGLMYYTLDGSDEAQGYPTFLIIFERRNHTPNGDKEPYTFVHFHRVHPCRKKDGRMVPASRLVEECYRYMTSIPAKDVYAQQGDLVFSKNETQKLDSEKSKSVLEFESHKFYCPETPVKFWPNEAKSVKNRLGFVYAEKPFVLQHPEHEWVNFESGYYEIHRTRSWEANPSSVWTYVCD